MNRRSERTVILEKNGWIQEVKKGRNICGNVEKEMERKKRWRIGRSVRLVLWIIKHTWLFYAKSCFYIYIKYMICKYMICKHIL